MKAHCIEDGSFKGIVTSVEEYEKLKNGDIDWSDNVKDNMDRVTIPYSLFKRFMALDKAVENACKAAKEEADGDV